jgi:RNase P subunit RPR2
MKCQMCQTAEALEGMTVCKDCYDALTTGENAYVDSDESVSTDPHDAAAPCLTHK